jgi:predicted Zn-dependent peptidase
MKTRHIAFLLTLLLLSGAAFSQSSLKISQYKLDNGLTVILNEDHMRPEIFGLVVVKAGSKNDPADATGMAHYQEHMLFKGTRELGTINWDEEKPHIDSIFALYDQLGSTKDENRRKEIQQKINDESVKANEYAIPNELSNIIKSIGGTRLNANTGPDRTAYFNAFPSNQIEKWLEIYSHRFIHPVFRGFQSELEVVYEEKNKYSDMFQFNLLEEFNRNLFRNHPYGQQSMIGTIDDLKNPSLTNMYRFFSTYYVANNMALILSGDFSTEDVLPLIREKFSRLPSGEIPPMKEYKEDPFNGREVVEKRLSPIKIALLGFRTVPNGHADEIALDVCNGILNNGNETGLLDKLVIDNKLLAAMVLPMNHNDHGSSVMFVVPKVVGQKLEDAEKLVKEQLEILRRGEFEDATVEAVKNQAYVDFQLSMESFEQRVVMLAEIFAQNRDINEMLQYPEKVKKISREDILRVANTYYGDNYLAFFSKMGSPKKEKIDKPGYKPVLSNTTAESHFAKQLKQIEVKDPKVNYINFSKDVITSELKQGARLNYVKNPLNDIFRLEMKFGIGDYEIPELQYASDLMNYAGVTGLKVTDLKKEFARLGCTYSISSDESYTTVMLQGLESNMLPALALVDKILTTPELEKEKLDLIIQGEKTNRKMERSEPDNVAEALFQYIKYGDNSSYLKRLSMKEISALDTDTLVAKFQKALTYQSELHFTGIIDAGLLKSSLEDNISFCSQPLPSKSPVVKLSKVYADPTVFFVDKKKAVQSKIYLFVNGPEHDYRMMPYLSAFNLYFGGDFSGLVLQEIREYRSLAYTARAGFGRPVITGNPCDFTGYVGTQADKSIEAINVFNDLIRTMPEKRDRQEMIRQYLTLSALTIRTMPEKRDRQEMIRQYLTLSALTNRPDFRYLSQMIRTWKNLGYTEDPLKYDQEKYNDLTFDQVMEFYTSNLKNKPVVFSIVGNKKKVDMKALGKFGKIQMVKEDILFR